MNPAGAGRRSVGPGWEAGFDEAGRYLEGAQQHVENRITDRRRRVESVNCPLTIRWQPWRPHGDHPSTGPGCQPRGTRPQQPGGDQADASIYRREAPRRIRRHPRRRSNEVSRCPHGHRAGNRPSPRGQSCLPNNSLTLRSLNASASPPKLLAPSSSTIAYRARDATMARPWPRSTSQRSGTSPCPRGHREVAGRSPMWLPPSRRGSPSLKLSLPRPKSARLVTGWTSSASASAPTNWSPRKTAWSPSWKPSTHSYAHS